MGIISLAISTFIGSIFVSIYAIYDLFIKNTMMKLSYNKFKFDKKILSLLFIMGIPIILEKSSISFSFIIVNKYILNYGETVLAAYGITNKINSLIFSTVTGFGTGLATIVSQNLGADQAERAREGIKKAFIIAITTSAVIISIILLSKYSIAGLFAKDDKELLRHTVNAMSVYSISIIPWAVFQVVIGVFEGTGNTKMNLLISIARVYLFRLPLVIILSNFAMLQEYSIWYAMLLSNIFTGIFALILYLRNYKRLVLYGE
jgi:Na+-driven multidrug efflux pump